MPDPLFLFNSQSGVRRDGTELDSPFFSDAVWTRFQRGKVRKMGGYVQLSGQLNAPIRSVFVDQRNGTTIAHYFGQWGIQRQVLSGLSATGLIDRTPVGFTADANLNWSHGLMYSSTGGAYAALLACSAPDVLDISSETNGALYAGDSSGTAPLSVVSDGSPIAVSGGCCVLGPILFVYGNNGLIRNTNPNDYSSGTGWSGGNYANSANPVGTKVVYGAPVRGGGQTPAGLFWALDALVRVSFVGGTTKWQYDILSQPTSILGKKTVVENDGKFFWVGTDRFLFYNGVVQELPNQMNCNDFFENLNYTHRNKVWGTKIGRYGEIWWFYPRGSDTECNNAIIFNYNENTWYEAVCNRSAGHTVQTYVAPVWAGNEDLQATTALTIGFSLNTSSNTASGNATLNFSATTGVVNGYTVTSTDPGVPPGATVSSHTGTTAVMSAVALSTITAPVAIVFSSMTTAFTVGQTVTGSISGATGTLVRVSQTQLNLTNVTGTFQANDVLTAPATAFGTPTATALAAPFAQNLISVYRHETGWDKVVGQSASAIPASFTSSNFGFAIGTPFDDTNKTVNQMTLIKRMDPDFGQIGDLTATFLGKSYPNQDYQTLTTLSITESDNFISPMVQERILKVKVESNSIGGFFEGGQTWMQLEPGDERGSG